MIIGENLMNGLNSNYNDEKSGNNVLKFEVSFCILCINLRSNAPPENSLFYSQLFS